MSEAVNYNSALVDEIVRALPADGELLDFGAGLGHFAREVRATGRSVQVAELEPRHVAVLVEDGFRVHESLAAVPDASFSGVFSLNVLEHIEDDEAILSELLRVMRPGGSGFFYVPALPVLYSSMDRKVGHFRRYRRAELRTKLMRAGFSVVDLRYVDVLGVPAALLYRLLGNRAGDLDPRMVRLYDRFLFPASRVLDRATRRLVGKNLLAIVHRP